MRQSYEEILTLQKLSWKNVLPMLICVLSVFCRGRGTVDTQPPFLACPHIVARLIPHRGVARWLSRHGTFRLVESRKAQAAAIKVIKNQDTIQGME